MWEWILGLYEINDSSNIFMTFFLHSWDEIAGSELQGFWQLVVQPGVLWYLSIELMHLTDESCVNQFVVVNWLTHY